MAVQEEDMPPHDITAADTALCAKAAITYRKAFKLRVDRLILMQ